jgi:hypothetical protein
MHIRLPEAVELTCFVRRRNSETKIKLKRIEEEIRESYIREKMANSRNEVIESNKRIGIVMQNWMGLSLFDAFDGWRYAVELIQQQRRRDERRALKEARLRFEDEVARYEYEMIDVSLFDTLILVTSIVLLGSYDDQTFSSSYLNGRKAGMSSMIYLCGFMP